MNEHELRALIEEVRSGAISRRSFVQRMVALGLTAPMASTMLMHSGVAQAQAASSYKATKRGGGAAPESSRRLLQSRSSTACIFYGSTSWCPLPPRPP